MDGLEDCVQLYSICSYRWTDSVWPTLNWKDATICSRLQLSSQSSSVLSPSNVKHVYITRVHKATHSVGGDVGTKVVSVDLR